MELIYHYKDYKAIKDRIEEIERMTDAITDERCGLAKAGAEDAWCYRRQEYNALWDERHALENKIDEMQKQLIPEVGMPCTVHLATDSSGAHIEEVISTKRVRVKCDGCYSFTREFTYRKSGHWIERGTTSASPGYVLHLGYRHDYYDPSF